VKAPLDLAYSREPDGTPVLSVAGEVDRSNSADLAAAIEGVLESSARPLIVEMSRVAYLDSAGLSVLFLYATRIEVVIPPLLAPVLSVSGLGRVTAVRRAGEPPDGDGPR
jgi:anti-anti-sigma factor